MLIDFSFFCDTFIHVERHTATGEPSIQIKTFNFQGFKSFIPI